MRISKIIVENYCSIQRIEVLPNKFSVFVGQNNHGKTNFFEAIEWFYTDKSSKVDEHFNGIAIFLSHILFRSAPQNIAYADTLRPVAGG